MSVTPGRFGELVQMRCIHRETRWSAERTASRGRIDPARDLAAIALLDAIAVWLSLSLTATGIAGGLTVTMRALVASFVMKNPVLQSASADPGYRVTGSVARFFARVPRGADVGAILESFRGLGCYGSVHDWLAGRGRGVLVAARLDGRAASFCHRLGGTYFLDTIGPTYRCARWPETAMVTLQSLQGVPLSMAMTVMTIIRVAKLWFAVTLRSSVFADTERRSRKGADALENH